MCVCVSIYIYRGAASICGRLAGRSVGGGNLVSSVTRSHMQASRRETLAFAFNVSPHACCVEEGRDALALRKSVLIGPPSLIEMVLMLSSHALLRIHRLSLTLSFFFSLRHSVTDPSPR